VFDVAFIKGFLRGGIFAALFFIKGMVLFLHKIFQDISLNPN